jgi:ACS family hexuronate transporter-like MFS transporter
MPNPTEPVSSGQGAVAPETTGAMTRFRWIICALLFFSTTVNYMDRQVISYLKEYYCAPAARGGFGWSNSDFAYVTSFFTGVYAVMTVGAGWVIDKIGTKLGLALSLITWSVFGMLNAFVGRLVPMHVAVRSAFAVGEAGNFPASIKTVAEWFPKRERALATGIFNSGSNFGAMMAALFVPWCLIYFGYARGWKMAFIITGASGLLWLIFWFWLYDTPGRQKRSSKAEFDYIHIDDEVRPARGDSEDRAKVAWWRLFCYRQAWAFFVGKFMTDGIWWFYLFWLPDYLTKQFGMTTRQVIMPTFIMYGVSIVGSVYGGSIPMTLMKKGWPVYRARMTSMLLIAIAPLAVLSTQYFGDVGRFGHQAAIFAVATICIGTAAHQAWSANLFTTVSDMFPKTTVGSMTGLGTMAGGIGGVILQLLAGRLTDIFKRTPEHAYLIMFVICALSYLVAWAVMKALVPRHQPITDL